MGTLGEDNKVEQVFPPRRLVTFFIYLNSLPSGAGGHTEFPLLNLKVQPVRGQALLFCNVRQSGEPDERVIHRSSDRFPPASSQLPPLALQTKKI